MRLDPRDARIAVLEAELAVKEARIIQFEQQVAELEQKIVGFERQVVELRELLGRDSHNSHRPPSSDRDQAIKPTPERLRVGWDSAWLGWRDGARS